MLHKLLNFVKSLFSDSPSIYRETEQNNELQFMIEGNLSGKIVKFGEKLFFVVPKDGQLNPIGKPDNRGLDGVHYVLHSIQSIPGIKTIHISDEHDEYNFVIGSDNIVNYCGKNVQHNDLYCNLISFAQNKGNITTMDILSIDDRGEGDIRKHSYSCIFIDGYWIMQAFDAGGFECKDMPLYDDYLKKYPVEFKGNENCPMIELMD